MFGSSPAAIRAYQTLLYAPVASQERLTREILAMDQANLMQDNNQSALEQTLEDAPHFPHQTETVAKPDEQIRDAYDPNLVPETTTVYPSLGAVIDSIQISNGSGQTVNVLQPGEIYNFVVAGRFLRDFKGVYFGVHIKTVSGVEITGQRFPEQGVYLENVIAKESFRVCFSFRMDLLPGVYFAGGGVWSKEEPVCAHRIVDALMFRVSQDERRLSFGYVDLSSMEPSVQIKS